MNRRSKKLLAPLAVFGLAAALLIGTGGSSDAAAPTCFGKTATVPGSLNGTSGNDVIIGTSGPDRIFGGAGDDRICGLGGNDYIDGGSGSDKIDGGSGRDTLNGGSGNDSIVNDSSDRTDGGSGRDCASTRAGTTSVECTLPPPDPCGGGELGAGGASTCNN